MSRSKSLQWRTGMGIPGLLCAGFFALVSGIAYHNWRDGRSWGAGGWIPVGITLCLLLARSGIVVDGDRKQVTAWWGLWLPFLLNLAIFRKRWSVPGTAKVVLQWVDIGSSDSSWMVTSVFLEAEQVREICHFRSYPKTRREGERLAAALGLPLHDQTARESPSDREAGTLDRPLGERLRASGRTFPILPPPANAAVERTPEGRGCVFEVAKQRRKSLRQIRTPLTILALIASILLFELSIEQGPSRGLMWVVGVAVGILTLLALCLIHGATERIRLFASPAGLRKVQKTALSFSSLVIPVGELEELDVGISRTGSAYRVLSGRSDRALLEFGAGLEKQDLEWLLEAVLAAVYGPEGSEPPPARE